MFAALVSFLNFLGFPITKPPPIPPNHIPQHEPFGRRSGDILEGTTEHFSKRLEAEMHKRLVDVKEIKNLLFHAKGNHKIEIVRTG